MAKTGRHSDFTPEVVQRLLASLTSGTTIKDACAIAGIGETTYFRWMEIGKACAEGSSHKQKPAASDTELIARFKEFWEQSKRARASARFKSLQTVHRAGMPQWIHRKTGAIRYEPPPPITWMHSQTGELAFEEPVRVSDYERQFSGEAWSYNEPNWTAHAWYLERSDPASWAARNYTKIEGSEALVNLAKAKGIDLEDLITALIDEIENE